MSDDTSRRELGRFLRSRRGKITPAEVGLPTGARRRAVGLRREEVAVLAGLSPTWYTYLEQGRDIHPSVEVLESLARVLKMTEDERRYLHVLTNGRITKPVPLVGDLAAEDIVGQLVRAADGSPYPVYGVDLYCDLIAWNRATNTYYTDFDRVPPNHRNMMRWLLAAEQARSRLPDWSDDVRDVVARWRAMVANRDGGRRLVAMLTEFKALSPEFATWWEQHDVREHRSRTRRFRMPHGEETMRLIAVQAPEFASCVVVFHVPVGA